MIQTIEVTANNDRTSADLTMAEQKVTASISRIAEYLGQANDLTLDFVGMGRKKRDYLCNRKYSFSHDPDVGIMSIRNYKGVSRIYYAGVMGEVDAPYVDKVMCHEIGHILEKPLLRNTVTTCKVIGKLAQILLPFGSMIATNYTTDDISPTIAAGCGGYLAAKHTLPLLYWPMRLIEKRADDFSDRMVPEITGRACNKEICEKTKAPEALGYLIENEMSIQRFGSLFNEHPSNYTRNMRSDKNCPIYLEVKKKFGIPGLISA